MDDQLITAIAEAMAQGDKIHDTLGMERLEVSLGGAVFALDVTQAHANGHGICHGGVIFTLADSAFAYACNSHNDRAVAQHNSITYVAPAKIGDRLTATALELSRTGRSGITDVIVTNQAGETIALFRGHSRTIGGQHVAIADC